MNKRLTIAIDGYSSSGKSTFAKRIAARLGYVFIDSGAMYRAVTLYAIRQGFTSGGTVEEQALVAALDNIHIEFRFDPDREASDLYLNGEKLGGELRTIEVSNLVSEVSKIGAVRRKLVEAQREMGREGGVVMDGRDIGTVVFPYAELKIFLTADPAVRALRRYEELRATGQAVSLEDIERNIRQRDHEDETRAISPLRRASDAVELDNSHLTLDQQMAWVDAQLAKLDA
ncbi:MAG: (d)CMP kinase [Rikenellaceae bacterium]|jgi:cytidylate kinase|nr:(d)CMP kinase [Rikenellaceae bacterium]